MGLEFLACVVFAYYLVRHPEIIGEAISEWAHAAKGEESPAAEARRQRLADAGVDPSPGTGMSGYLGNVWRDFWSDQDAKRRSRRGQEPKPSTGGGRARKSLASSGSGWWERVGATVGQWADRVIDRQAAKWRQRHAERGGTPPPVGPQSDTGAPFKPQAPAGDDSSTPDEGAGDLPPESQPTPPPREPIRVHATVGEPVPSLGPSEQTAPQQTATAVLDREGEPMSAVATRGGAVTGMTSGAAEARSIQRALDAATADYDAAVASARKRIHSLGEQTLANIQMSGKSDVIASLQQAAEAIASAQNGVNACKAEVIPILGVVAKRFEAKAN